MYKYSCLNILAIFSPLKFQARLQVLVLSHNTIAQGFVIERAWRLCYQQSRLLASKWNSAVSTKKEQTHSERSVAWRCERKREREEIIFYPGTKYTKLDKNERKEIARFLFVIWQTHGKHTVYGNWHLNVKKDGGRDNKDF